MVSTNGAKYLRARQKLGKYRIDKRLADGGFATVYKAMDTIEGVAVALKIPHASLVDRDTLEAFRREVRVTAKLDHPNILPIKAADFVDGRFVIACPLGGQSLGERLHKRMSARTALNFAEQMIDAVAFAHEKGVMHCDIKPDNLLLFPDNRLRLTDFGIARVARHTVSGSGTGTVGYIAPEQAVGKPSLRSDVFSLGLIVYRMFAGYLPEWPYDWPPPGFDRVRRVLHGDVLQILHKALEVDHRKRYRDAIQLQYAFHRVRGHALRSLNGGRRTNGAAKSTSGRWRTVRFKEFTRLYGRILDIRHECGHCGGPISEAMRHCPWCAVRRRVHDSDSRFPQRCPRCRRGVKRDWRYCPWCYGAAIGEESRRRYSDARYTTSCTSRRCTGGLLMPFMRYCPWCRLKVRQRWAIEGSKCRCKRCGWGVLPEYWDICPWCADNLPRR